MKIRLLPLIGTSSVTPDVVVDHQSTTDRSRPWNKSIATEPKTTCERWWSLKYHHCAEQQLANWKRLRWVAWASRHGLKDVWSQPDFRFLKIAMLLKDSQHEMQENIMEAVDQKESSSGRINRINNTSKRSKREEPSKNHKVKSKASLKSQVSTELLFSWLDFHLTSNCLDSLYIVHRPSQFSFSIKISNVASEKSKKIDKIRTRSKSSLSLVSEKKPKEKLWSTTLLNAKNQPILLFTDSLDDKIFILRYYTLNMNAFEYKYDDDKEIPTLSDNVLIDELRWRSAQCVVPCLTIEANTTEILEFPKGRHVMRLWINCATTYTLQIYGNTSFEVGSFEKISELMCFESLRFLDASVDIGNSFLDLIESLGTSDFDAMLKKYYASYSPDLVLKDRYAHGDLKIELQDMFTCELCRVLRENCVKPAEYEEIVQALRVLFLNTHIGADYIRDRPCEKLKDQPNITNKSKKIFCDDEIFIYETEIIYKHEDMCESSEIEGSYTTDETDIEQKAETIAQNAAATIIQSSFRRHVLQNLKSYHSPQNNLFNNIANNLRKIYDVLFSPKKRESVVPKILRRFLDKEYDAESLYSIYNDCKFILKSITYRGVLLNTRANSWVPITRVLVFCHSLEPTCYRVEVFCTLPTYIVRVFNNDTNEELDYFGSGIGDCLYRQNHNGYTIVAYGWSDDRAIKETPWKLVIYGAKESAVIHICDNNRPLCQVLPATPVVTERLSNYYIPCNTKRLFKCLIRVKHNTLVTLALNVTNIDAKIALVCLNENGVIIGKVVGRGNVVYPVLLVEYDTDLEDSSKTEYTSSQEPRRGLSKELGVTRKRRTSRTSSSLESVLSPNSVGSFTDIIIADARPKHLRRPFTNPKKEVRPGRRLLSPTSTRKSLDNLSPSMQSLPDTVYAIEAYVLDDTWPLCPEEWDVVDEEIKKRSLKATLSPRRRLSSIRVSKRLSSKNSELKLQLPPTVKKPGWILDVMSNVGEIVKVVEDHTTQAGILAIKQAWEDTEPGRLRRGEIIRTNFLKCMRMKHPYCAPLELEGEIKNQEKAEEKLLIKRDILTKMCSYVKRHAEDSEESIDKRDMAHITLRNMKNESMTIVREANEEVSEKEMNNKMKKEPEKICVATAIHPELIKIRENIRPLVAELNPDITPTLVTQEYMDEEMSKAQQEEEEFKSSTEASYKILTNLVDQQLIRRTKMIKYYEELRETNYLEYTVPGYRAREDYIMKEMAEKKREPKNLTVKINARKTGLTQTPRKKKIK